MFEHVKRANRGHRARSSIPRVLEKSYLRMRKRLGGRSTLEQGSTRILGHLGNDCARVARVRSSRASMVVPMLCSSMLVHNTKRVPSRYTLVTCTVRHLHRRHRPMLSLTILKACRYRLLHQATCFPEPAPETGIGLAMACSRFLHDGALSKPIHINTILVMNLI